MYLGVWQGRVLLFEDDDRRVDYKIPDAYRNLRVGTQRKAHGVRHWCAFLQFMTKSICPSQIPNVFVRI